MTALPALKYEQPTTPFVAWLQEEMFDHRCGAVEFAQRYGFAESTVRAWLSGRRVPSLKMCRKLATRLRATVVEVVASAGHITFAELDDYNHAFASSDDLGNVVLIGE